MSLRIANNQQIWFIQQILHFSQHQIEFPCQFGKSVFTSASFLFGLTI